MNAQLKPIEPDLGQYIGGGNVAGILGLSPYKTPYAEYLGILEGRTPEQNEERRRFFARRKALEPFAIDVFQQATGLAVVRTNHRFTDPEHDFIKAEIDGETFDANIEIKTVHPLAAAHWGEPGNDDCPVYVTAQAMHGLMVTGRSLCYVMALIGFDDDRIYKIERDEITIAAIRKTELEFWARVQERRAPDPANSSDLLRMFLKDSGASREVEFDDAALVYELKEIKGQVKALEAKKDELEESVKMLIGADAALTVDAKPIATWKTQDNNRFNAEAFAAAHPSLYEAFKRNNPTRVLRIK